MTGPLIYVTTSTARTRRRRMMKDPAITTAIDTNATATGVSWRTDSRKLLSPTISRAPVGESHASDAFPVIARAVFATAAVKKMMPAYITPTNRRLLDSDDSASIATAERLTSIADRSAIAGTRYAFLLTNA